MENEYMFSPIRWGEKKFWLYQGCELTFLYPTGGGIPVYRATWGVGGRETIFAFVMSQPMSLSISLPLNTQIYLQEGRSRMFRVILFIKWKIKNYVNAHWQENSSTNYEPTVNELFCGGLEEQVVLIGCHMLWGSPCGAHRQHAKSSLPEGCSPGILITSIHSIEGWGPMHLFGPRCFRTEPRLHPSSVY